MVKRRDKLMLALPLSIGSGVVLVWELLTAVPRPLGLVVIGAGVLWTAFAVGWIGRNVRLGHLGGERALENPELLRKVLDEAMPPTFVKVWDAEAERGDHVFENRAFHRVQDATATVEVEEERRRIIHDDHRHGDLAAIRDGRSVQLEVSDRRTGNAERPILTTKTRVVVGDTTYIVGWFVPVAVDGAAVVKAPIADATVRVRERGFHAVFRLAHASQEPFEIPVGQALRTARAAATD